MKNWKRYLSVAMTLVMLLGVLPTAAFAEGETALTGDNVTVEAATYSGTAQTPVIKIGGNTAQKDVDYTYSVAESKELKNAGDYSLTITGMGTYSGSVDMTFTIARKTMTADDFTLTECAYTGSAVKPDVYIGSTKLTEGTDYTIDCTNNINAGEVNATVTFMGNYSGENIAKAFTIKPKDISDANMGNLLPAYKPGSQPEPVLYLAGYGLLREGTDYDLSCTGTDTLTITATGKNNFSGTVMATVPVLDDNDRPVISGVTGGETYYEEKTITVTDANLHKVIISHGEETVAELTPDAEGKVTYTLTLANAPYTIVARDKVDNVTSISVTISKKPIASSMITVADADNIVFDSTAKTPAITVQDGATTIADDQYTLSWENNTNAGTATVKVTMNSSAAAYKGDATKTFTIKPKTLTAPTIEIPGQTYTGSPITPAVTVTDGDKTLTLNTDYTVTYSNNTNAAAADADKAPTATVKFQGNYTGADVTKTFTISPKDISTAVLGGLKTTYNPGISPVPTTVTLDGKTLVEGTDYTVSHDNTTPGTLIIEVKGKGNYTGTKQATVAVLATSDTTAPVISGVSNGGTYNEAKTITVTDTNLEKVEIYQGTTLVNNLTPAAGTTTVSTTLALSDTAYVIKAYDKVGNKTEFTVTVTRKSITASMITIADADNIVFDGTAKTPAITVKDGTTTIAADQYTLSWENNTNAGTATVKVTMKSDATAYKGEATKTFTIKAKTITSSSAIADIADQTYTGSPLTPTITVKDGTTTLVMGSDKDYTVIYSDNTNPGTAKVTVVLRGNYLGVLQKTFTINPNLTVLADNIKTLAAKTTLTYAEQQQAKQLKAAYDSLSAENKAIVDAAVGTTLMASFKNKVSAAAYKLLNKPAVGYYKHVQGTSSNVAIKIDADFSRTLVTEIRMGKYDTVIDPANYTVTEGSVVVTLSSSYLKTIKTTGKYNLYIDLTDIQTGHTETLQTVVRIVPATDIPQTGDPFRMNLWIGLLGASVLALAGLGVYEVLKKKKNSQKRLEAAMDLGENADKVNIPE